MGFKIFNNEGQQIGTVNKKWAGALKEIFTTADKYKLRSMNMSKKMKIRWLFFLSQ